MRVGEKVVFIDNCLSFSMQDLIHLTKYKIYTISQDSPDTHVWIIDDSGHEGGYGYGSYTFEKLSKYRNKKLKKLNENIFNK